LGIWGGETMKKYISLRLFFILVNLFIVVTVYYFGLEFATNEKYYHLPFDDYFSNTVENYKEYLSNIFLHNDWGLSNEGDPVWEILVPRIILSTKYNIIALLFYLPAGIIVGFATAYFYGTWFDKAVNWILLVLSSIPTYIFISLLILTLGFYVPIFHYQYVEGYTIRNYLLPIFALSLWPIMTFARIVRGEILAMNKSAFVLLARVKGLSRFQTTLRHVLKNCVVAILPEIPTVFLFTLTGTFFVEIIYSIEGVGELMFWSLLQLGPFGVYYVFVDMNIMMVVSLYYVSAALIVSFLSDISYRLFDPRIRIGGTNKPVSND